MKLINLEALKLFLQGKTDVEAYIPLQGLIRVRIEQNTFKVDAPRKNVLEVLES